MKHHKNDFEKLSPADQIAINTMVKDAKADELIDAYKRIKTEETLSKKSMSLGETLALIFIIGLVLFVIIAPAIQLITYSTALQAAGPSICKANNSTFIDIELHSLSSIKVICADFIIKLP
jgi:hypothetical protein